MGPAQGKPITEMLAAAGRGEPGSRETLWRAVYDELRRMARSQMAHERPGRTLQPTALVHEVYFRLFGDGEITFNNRKHFFGAAAQALRRVLVDDARSRKRLKRGGNAEREERTVFEAAACDDLDLDTVLAVDEALDDLANIDSRKADVVKLRYFAGMNEEETAAALGVSRRTVQLDWNLAKAWLHRALSERTVE